MLRHATEAGADGVHDRRREDGNRLSAPPDTGPCVKTWTLLGIAIAIAVGSVLPLQALINARLGALTHGPLYAAFVSFLVGTCLLGAALLAMRSPLVPTQPLGSLPAWIWTGGAIGACMVLAGTVLVPRLGAGALFCLLVLGQVVGALLLDHFGVLGARRPVDLARLAGALLVVVGTALVVRPWKS
ncbi:transporter family-2 protein [Luteimonas sp. J16]|jgi:transporter family-2 protein|nr:transporter family-2 protein [Luteimonas sp. J16]